MPINNPRDIPGLVGWYSAEAVTGLSDNQAMTQWNDLSGNGNHSVSVVGTPKWRAAAGPSGGPAIEFVNEGQYFVLPNVMNGAAAGEGFQHIKGSNPGSTAGSNGQTLGNWDFGTYGTWPNHYPWNGDGNIMDDFGSSSRRENITPTMSLNVWRRYNAWSAPNDWALNLDGAAIRTDATNTVAWRTDPSIGQKGHVSDGTISLTTVLLYNRKLTAQERADLDAWMVANPSGGTAVPASYADTVLADQPLAYYRLDETSGTTMTDNSGNGRNGTYVGSPTLGAASLVASDTAGKSVDFQGGQRGEVTYASWMDPAAFSVEAVIRADTWPANAVIMSKNHVAGGGWLLRVDSGVLKFWTANVNTWSSLDYAISTGTTYHIAGTYDGTTARLYVDGVERASAARTITTNTDNLGIGANYNDSFAQRFDGRIDEVAFYGAALPAKRIRLRSTMVHKNLGTYQSEVLSDSPRLYLPLDETTGTVAEDASPNNRDGTYLGTYTLGQASLIASTTGSKSVDVVGGGRIEVAGETTDHTSWSVEATFVTDKSTGYQVIASRHSSSIPRWTLRVDNGILFFYGNNGGWWSLNLGAINIGQVYHIAATYDGATARIYLDGVLINSHTNTIRSDGTPPALSYGANVGDAYSEQFDGRIDATSYYGTALTETRVREHWAASQIAIPAQTGPPVINQAKEIDTAGSISVLPWLGQAKEVDTAQAITVVREVDDFNLPRVVIGPSGSLTYNQADFTLEAGEPNVHGATKTGWFLWDPPDYLSGDTVRVHAAGNADATLAVYTGTALGSLTLVGSNDGTAAGYANVEFTVVAGTTYLIQLGTKGAGTASAMTFTWASLLPEEYDAFATPLGLAGSYGSNEFTLTNGTTEAGEPLPLVGTKSTSWLSWIAPETKDVNFTFNSVNGSSYYVRVYTGSTLGGLTTITSGTGSGTVPMSFSAVAGTTYRIQVSAVSDLDAGFDVSWSLVATPVPPASVPYPYPVPSGAAQVPHVRLRAQVYQPDGVTLITEVPRRVGVKFQEPLNVVGVGSMTVHLDDPVVKAYPTLLNFGNIVKFWLGSKCVHGFIIKQRNVKYVDGDERSGYVADVSGPSVQYLLDDFIVRHDGPPRPDSPESRFFSWASRKGDWYNAADWDATVNQWSMDNPPSNKKKNKPKNWKVRTAKWINTNKGGGGNRYFRKEWECPTEGLLVRVFATADEWWRLYVDGDLVLSGDRREVGYTEKKRKDLVLSKGTHTFAAYAKSLNSSKGDGNDSFLFALCEVDLDGKIIKPPLLVSNNTWKAHVGNPPPGWNRAHVLKAVLEEAQGRGINSAERLVLGFTGSADSDGVAWPDTDVFNQEVGIGTSALDLQAQLSEGNGFDVWVDPETLTLDAWVRRGADKSASVTLEPGRNLIDWEVEERDEIKNKWLLRFDKGWTEYDAPNSQATFGEREAYVSLGGVKEEKGAKNLMRRAARGIAKAQKRAGTGEIKKRPKGQPDGGLIGVEGAFPFLDFAAGDTVKAPNGNGVLVPQRVLSLSCTEDSTGLLSFDPDMEEVSADE